MGMTVRKRVPQVHKTAPASKRGVRQQAPRQGSGQAFPIARKRQQKPRSDRSGPQSPAFARCTLVGPDGTERPGWEMWVGQTLFGRADSKETLLQYYARLSEPMPSGHWRERSWYTRRPHHARSQEEEEGGGPPQDETLDLGEASDGGLDPQLWE
jgi:hypothetical protein